MRDREYEDKFLGQLCKEVMRCFGLDATAFRVSVERRLAIGAERYGDDDFLRKNVVEELLDETPDVAAYALLQTQKLLHDPLDDEGRAWHLFEAAKHAAVADWHARQARNRD